MRLGSLVIRGRAIGLLARVPYPDLPPDPTAVAGQGVATAARNAALRDRSRPLIRLP